MKTIILSPKMNRAETCVDEHGPEFELAKDQGEKILCKCICPEHQASPWIGWFNKNEADWEAGIAQETPESYDEPRAATSVDPERFMEETHKMHDEYLERIDDRHREWN